MLSLADVATQLQLSKAFALALPRFHKKTGLSAQISFVYNNNEQNIEISLGFSPKEPTQEEYSILVEELFDAEKLLINEYIINTSIGYENINQFVFKHKEESNQIVSKHREES